MALLYLQAVCNARQAGKGCRIGKEYMRGLMENKHPFLRGTFLKQALGAVEHIAGLTDAKRLLEEVVVLPLDARVFPSSICSPPILLFPYIYYMCIQ